MRKLFLLFALFIFFAANSQKLQVYYYQSSFWNPKQGPYTEVYTTFVGKTFKYVKVDKALYNCKVELTIIYKQNGEVKQFRKLNIPGIASNDSIGKKINFVDLQRMSIEPGKYDFEINIKDINNETNILNYTDTITIPSYKNVGFSDIELIEKLKPTEITTNISKYGYDLVPYVSDYFPTNIEKLIFLVELYNIDKVLKVDEDFIVTYYIEPADKSVVLDQYTKTERYKAKDINILVKTLNIKKLPSGNYNLVIEAIDKNHEQITSTKLFFQRSNVSWDKKIGNVDTLNLTGTFVDNINSKDTIRDYIKSLFPILAANENTYANNQLKTDNIILMKKFFYSYWYGVSNLDPEGEWKKYKAAVYTVNKNYSSQIQKGYETDRGRIFLKYGPPNSVRKRDHSPGTYPYEIWHYYKLINQGNKRVVFYNPNLVGENYELVHTDIIGEISNPGWNRVLIRNNEEYQNSYGDYLKQDYND